MFIPLLAEEQKYILSAHHEKVEKPNPEEPEKPIIEDGAPLADAPVFVYKPLNPREKAVWTSKLFGEGAIELGNTRYLDLYDERVVRIDNLFFGDDLPYDHTVEKHRQSIDLQWQVEVAMAIFANAKLTEVAAGK